MQDEPRYDFPAVSGDDIRRAGPALGDAKFGDVVMEEMAVFQDVGGDWRKGEWGPQVGTVTLTHTPTTVSGRIPVTATFVFDDGDMVVYRGLVPGDGSWVGRGRFGYVTGTGKFADRGGQLDVESTNPRHWG